MNDFLQVCSNGVAAGSEYALVAIGFALTYRVFRFFNLAYGVPLAIAPYGTYFLLIRGVPLAVSGACGVVAAIGSGLLIELMLFRRLRNSSCSPLGFLLASLGMLFAVQSLMSLCFGDSTLSIRTKEAQEGFRLLAIHITPVQVTAIILSIAIAAATWALVDYSHWGVILRAIGSDAELSTIMGVNRNKTGLSIAAIGALVAGTAGLVTGYDVGLVPSIGYHAVLGGVVAMIIGGCDSTLGPLAAGICLGAVENGAAWFLPTQWQNTTLYLVLVLILLLRPEGLTGQPRRSVAL